MSAKSNRVQPRPCLVCGTMFKPHDNKRPGKYCSRACRDAGKREVATVPCAHCGQRFKQDYPTQKFCSRDCNGASQATIKPRACLTCGKVFHPRVNAQAYCSRTCGDIGQTTGTTPRAGKTFSAAKKRRIFERDGFMCVRCGSSDRLAADHIVAVMFGGDHSIENGQTLCHACHWQKTRMERRLFRALRRVTTSHPSPVIPTI